MRIKTLICVEHDQRAPTCGHFTLYRAYAALPSAPGQCTIVDDQGLPWDVSDMGDRMVTLGLFSVYFIEVDGESDMRTSD